MALALSLPPSLAFRETLIVLTFGVVLFSLLVQGMTISPLLKRLGLAGAPNSTSPEVARTAARIIRCNAAIEELERIRTNELHPTWATELLLRRYRDQLTPLELHMRSIAPEYQASEAKQSSLTKRRALVASKNALREAGKEGWLDDNDWREIAHRIDQELLDMTVP